MICKSTSTNQASSTKHARESFIKLKNYINKLIANEQDRNSNNPIERKNKQLCNEAFIYRQSLDKILKGLSNYSEKNYYPIAHKETVIRIALALHATADETDTFLELAGYGGWSASSEFDVFVKELMEKNWKEDKPYPVDNFKSKLEEAWLPKLTTY